MGNMFFVFLFILSFILVILGIKIINTKKEFSLSLGKAFLGAAITMFVYAIAGSVTNETIANIFFALYYIATDMLVIEIIKFYNEYTKGIHIYNKFKYIFFALTAIDSVELLCNVFVNHAYTLNLITYHGHTMFNVIYQPAFVFHFAFIYSLIFIAFMVLLLKIILVKGIYKIKYAYMLSGYSFVIFLNLFVVLLHVPIDYSVVSYGLLAFICWFFNYHFIPGYIKDNLKNYIVDNMKDAVICYDVDGICVYYNSVAKDLLNLYDKTNYKKFYKNKMEKYDLKNKDDHAWNEIRIKDDKCYYYIEYYQKMYDSHNEFIGTSFIIQDNTKKVLAEKEKRRLLSHDPLTALYNREMFGIKVEELINNSNKQYLMVCTDIRNFKLINDIYGIEKGDEILKEVAGVLDNLYKENVNVAYSRLSRDNFAICIPKADFKPNKLVKDLNQVNKIIDKNINFYIQIGIYEINDKEESISKMYDNANLAIKYNKNDFKKLINYYDSDIKDNIVREQNVLNEFNRAVLKDEFTIFLQPQINKNGKLAGSEALVRWYQPERGYIAPGEFIPVLEKNGLIDVLDVIVWEKACKQLSKWKDNKLYISINISPNDFYHVDVEKKINDLVSKYNIDKKRLRLEITETAFMEDKDTRIDIIKSLRKSGFIVEMDDFGSGYSSLNLLKNIDFDVIKMDMGFLMDINNSKKSKYIISTIIDLCKKIGMKVVSEGVETEEQVKYLTEFGCDTFQGYYFDKPMPIKDFEEKYLERK